MIKHYIHQPYPLFENRWRYIISISLFVTFFMLIFQPFGLSNYKGDLKYYFETGYGIITFSVLIIDLFIIPFFLEELFKPEDWSVLKQLIGRIWILFSIGLANYLYSSLFLTFSNGLKAFLIFQFYTLVVGIIPLLILTILHQNALLRKNLELANEMNRNLNSIEVLPPMDKKIRIMSNSKEKLEINLSDFIYIGSNGNYIQVFFLVNNSLNSILLRNTLKQIEEQVKGYPTIIKCHRAFLVNKDKIIQVKGNSQGIRLVLKETLEEIPVSRNYSKSLKNILNR